jgi:hypothetical protein
MEEVALGIKAKALGSDEGQGCHPVVGRGGLVTGCNARQSSAI